MAGAAPSVTPRATVAPLVVAPPVGAPLAVSAMTFDEACEAVVEFLKEAVPLGYWSVSRYDGERQLYLHVRDDTYGTAAGDSHAWDASLCRLMVAGAPQVAPDATAVPEYAGAGIAQQIPIGAYVGVPIRSADGELFGTICGLDPTPRDERLLAHAPLLRLLGRLLTTVLQADRARSASLRLAERAEREAETDLLTGVGNRRRWARFLEQEETRLRAYGDPAAVLVLDLDGLKQVNDTDGHAAGDGLIQRAAAVLEAQLRDADLVARLGGDEFGVVAVGLPPSQLEALVGRLRSALAGEGVAASVGAASYTLARGLVAAWEEADLAMYADKQRGRALRLAG